MCSTTMSAAECIEIPEMERQINQLEEIEGEINELVFKHWVVKRKIDELEMEYRQIEDENPPFDVMVDDPNYDDAIEHMGMIQDRIDDLMVELHDIQEKIDNCDIWHLARNHLFLLRVPIVIIVDVHRCRTYCFLFYLFFWFSRKPWPPLTRRK